MVAAPSFETTLDKVLPTVQWQTLLLWGRYISMTLSSISSVCDHNPKDCNLKNPSQGRFIIWVRRSELKSVNIQNLSALCALMQALPTGGWKLRKLSLAGTANQRVQSIENILPVWYLPSTFKYTKGVTFYMLQNSCGKMTHRRTASMHHYKILNIIGLSATDWKI